MDRIRGHLDLLVLSVLADGEAHGYVLIEELRRRSAGAFDLPEGTVYPALHRLEEAGLLGSSWSADGGRRRRIYRLTRRGRAALKREREAWNAFARAVDVVLGSAS